MHFGFFTAETQHQLLQVSGFDAVTLFFYSRPFAAAWCATSSLLMSSAVSYGWSIVSVTLWSLPVKVNGGLVVGVIDARQCV